MKKPLFEETIPTSTVQYVGVPVHGQELNNVIGLQIGWKDATANATITLELTSVPSNLLAVDEAGEAWEWIDSGEAISGPAASAAGGVFVNIENVRQTRARLVITTTAISPIIVWDGAA